VPDERAEARLAAAAVHLLGQRGALESERDLRAERPKRCTDGLRRHFASRHDEQHAILALRDEVQHERPVVILGQFQRPKQVGAQPGDLVAVRGGQQRRVRLGCDARGGAQPRDQIVTRHRPGRGQRDLVDLLTPGGRDEIGSRGAQHALALE
jgi:hypothetical protein